MKKAFFLRRRNALILTLVVVLLATIFGIHRSLGGRMREVADGFDEGVYNEELGYRTKSIRSQLVIRCESSMDALTVAGGYSELDGACEGLRVARSNLVRLLEGKGGPAALYDADAALERAFSALYDEAEPLVSAADLRYLDEDRSRMDGAAGVIAQSGYNASVRAFSRDVLSVFPTNLLRVFCFVDPPELFE